MSTARRAIWIASMGLAVAMNHAAADHPFHSTRATIEFNEETGSFEVSLFAFPDDLAQALSDRAGKKVDLETDPDVDQLLQKYIGDEFQLRLDGGKPIAMQWIGYETEAQQIWLYFEFLVETRTPAEVAVKNTLLMKEFDDQINVAYVRFGQRQRCLTFRTDTPSWERWRLERHQSSIGNVETIGTKKLPLQDPGGLKRNSR